MEDKTKPMCRSGCGFYGNPAMDGFCSFCYHTLVSKEQSCLTTTSITSSSTLSSHSTYDAKMLFVEKRSKETTTSTSNSNSNSNSLLKTTNIGEANITLKLNENDKPLECTVWSDDDKRHGRYGKISGRKSLRCAAKNCRRKLGLTDVQCRCGERFCPIHRYSDRHECTFDYREFGAQEIRRKNPKVVGEKITKI